MSGNHTSCPPPETLIAWLDGELTANESERISAHASTCDTCRAQEARLRSLSRTLKTVGNRPPDRAFVQAVVSGLSTRPARAAFQFRPVWALAAAGAVALLVFVRLPREGSFVARGSAEPGRADARHLGFTVNVTPRSGSAHPLAPGELVHPGDGFTFTLQNLSWTTPYFMVLALDGASEVHWFYPAFPTADADPVSPHVPVGASSIPLPEGVTPASPAAGTFRFLALFSPAPLRARAVEAELKGSSLASFTHSHPGVTLQVLTVRLAP